MYFPGGIFRLDKRVGRYERYVNGVILRIVCRHSTRVNYVNVLTLMLMRTNLANRTLCKSL